MNEKTPENHKLKSSKYSGTYQYGSYGDTTQSGPGGQIKVYAESDDTVLFYIDVSRGSPSYNMGSLYDKFYVGSDKGVFYKKFKYTDKPCKWSFVFNDSTLIIETIDDCYDCGFGGNVFADGTYKKVNFIQPDYFEDAHGRKIYFAKTKPGGYLK